jgi:protein-disulfide isomerase
MELSVDEVHIHRRRNWIASVVTLIVLILLGVFVWRVMFFADLIRSGEIDLSNYNFLSDYTLSANLLSEPLQDGTFDVATDDDPSLGVVGAPVTIVEFADFLCGYSRESSFILRELAAKYPQQIQYIYRDFPLSDIHPLSQIASEAAQCAHEQNKFWEFHDRIYQNQSSLSEGSFVEFARELNLNVAKFEECLTTDKMGAEVLVDYADGVKASVRGTPTFFINGNRVVGAIPKATLETIIKSVAVSQ